MDRGLALTGAGTIPECGGCQPALAGTGKAPAREEELYTITPIGPDSVQRLEIWREGTELVKAVYLLSREWPKHELYGLTAQARRAAVSIPANLAEGVGRGTPAEAARFAQVALGSLYELDTLLYLASELGFSQPKPVETMRQCLAALARRISSFVSYKQRRT